MEINIFLASSEELKEGRNSFQVFRRLGYALKDQTKADWEKAHESFTTAILIRDNACPEYFMNLTGPYVRYHLTQILKT